MKQLRTLTWCLALGCALSITACGDDADDGGEGGSAGNAGDAGGEGGTSGGGAGGTSGAGAGGASGGGAGGAGGGAGDSDAGADDDASIDDDDGGIEVDELIASAELEPLEDNDINGTATFTTEEADVSLHIELNDCPDGSYQVHIHEGADCTNFGPHWDVPRGDGIPNVTCSKDRGELTYVRTGSDPKPWSVDLGSEETDVEGHTFVVHDADGTALACGEINADD